VTDIADADRPVNLRSRTDVEAIYRRDGPAVRGFLRHSLDDPRAADDVLQETFLELWRKPHGYDPARGSIRQYLFGIARHRAAQWRRDHAARPRVDVPSPRTADPAESAALRQTLRQLDEDARALLWLREVEGYSYAELAAVLEVPLGTVKSRLFNARIALRRAWLGEADRPTRATVR
jgi:RNA polymerase sigma-70 factor (ECF subfamily)